MDHAYVEQNGLIALYRGGRLDPEEEQRFEEHYFSCDACQEELDHQRRFELGLQAMRAERAVPVPTESKPAAKGKMLRFPRRPTVWLPLAASLLLAASLPFALLWQIRADLEREAATWRGRAQQEESEKRALAERLAASDEKMRQLEIRLAQGRAPLSDRDPLGRPMAPTAPPMANTPLLLLTHLRGSEPSPTANRLDLRGAEGIVQLALDAGIATGFGSYRATLTDAAGKKLFAADDLQPNALEVILLTFPHEFFAKAEYRLRLEGRRADGTFEEIEQYKLHVVQ